MEFSFITQSGQVRLVCFADILALGYLAQKPKQSAKSLALAGASNCYQSMKHRLDKLREQGYVEREKLPHTVGYQYSLTKAGRDRARELSTAGRDFFTEACAALEQAPF